MHGQECDLLVLLLAVLRGWCYNSVPPLMQPEVVKQCKAIASAHLPLVICSSDACWCSIST